MKFESEAHLVRAFVSTVDPEAWTVYPETGDFDLLLSRRSDGFQVGIEAKMSLNMKVVSQAADLALTGRQAMRPGPDCRAVLVPWGKTRSEFEKLVQALQIVVLRVSGRASRPWVSQSLPDTPDSRSCWPEHFPAARIPLPDFVPDVAAGVAGPTKLSMWKVKAIKLVVLLRHRGYLVRADFVRLDLSPSIWTQRRWIVSGAVRGQWVEGSGIPDFQKQHPLNYAQISADLDRWNWRDLEGVI